MKSTSKPTRRKAAKKIPEVPLTSPRNAVPATPASPIASASAAPAPGNGESQKPSACKATFSLYAPHAQRVSVCGEFNAWSPDAAPMSRRGDGSWEAALLLPPGRYQYKFVADGQWLTDPNAAESVPNIHGSLNSVLEIGS